MLALKRFQVGAEVIRNCPACDGDRPHREVWRKWGYPILACRNCGLGRTDVVAFDPSRFYTADYFSGGRTDGYGDYIGSANVLLREFRSVLHAMSLPRKARVLELGSAYGFFLEVAQAAGHDAVGLEICDDAVRDCQRRGLNACRGILDQQFLANQGLFDAVVMLDVIEHLPDPAETMALVAQALKPGGTLCITTGDWSSALSCLTRSHWRLMTPPQHLFFYSRRTLTTLVIRHGFAVQSLSTPWKRVPLGLMAYQFSRRLGLPCPLPRCLHQIGLPINLFDSIRLVAQKEAV